MSHAAEQLRSQIKQVLRVLAVELLDGICEFTLIHTLRKLSLQFLTGLSKIFFIGLLSYQVLAKFGCDFSIFVNRFKHHLDFVPKAILVLFESLVSFKQLSVKSGGQLLQLIFESPHFSKHLFICALLLLSRLVNIFLLGPLRLFHLFFQLIHLSLNFLFQCLKLTLKAF